MNENAPINIILVTSGSRGQRLLFRYPFIDPCCCERQNPQNKQNQQRGPYSRAKPVRKFPSQTHFLQNGELYGLSDVLLASLLDPKLCETNFEVNIDKIKLVGYPVLVTGNTDNYEECMNVDGGTKEDFVIKMVHVVLAMHSNADTHVVKEYQNICRMVGKALQHEEKRCRYLRNQREIMNAQRDYLEKLPEAEQNEYQLILKESELARALRDIFNSINTTGILNVKINSWLNLNYSLPHVVHNGNKTLIKETRFNNFIHGIKPYHTILLLDENRNNLLSLLPVDSSPVLKRLIKYSNHVKNFQTICQDADIALPQIFQIVAHLLYWGKCAVIYPLAESNVYVLSEDAPTEIDSKAAGEFVKTFSKHSLHNVLASFSFPTTLGDYRNLLCNSEQQLEQAQIVSWLLKRRFLKQLHTYVIIMPQPLQYEGEVNTKDTINLNPHEKKIFQSFSVDEKLTLIQLSYNVDKEDVSFFLSMSKYFRGEHHLENIMYYENVPRSKLLILIDKFRNMLITVQHQDSALV